MLSGISQKHNMRSSSCRFTESCNSQCLSHFAAPFIVVRTETSIAESCEFEWLTAREKKCIQVSQCDGFPKEANGSRNDMQQKAHLAPQPARASMRAPQGHPHTDTHRRIHNGLCGTCANDPSAGSPTETLLRLLLPLSGKVHKTFRCNVRHPGTGCVAVRIIHRITQSVGATGGVYKGQGRNQHGLMTHAY